MHREYVPGEILAAGYGKCGLSQYDDNPLIAALPSIMTEEEAGRALERKVEYNSAQRKLPAHIRQHALLAVLQFFQPLSHHLDLEGKISRMLRFGYVARNPTKQVFYQGVRQKADILRKIVQAPATTATSSTILGTSGTGKTTTVNRIFQFYPQVIHHAEFQGRPFSHEQLVWLKLECPFDGSIKALCRKFFEKVDALLGTNYYTLYGVVGLTADEMLPKIALVAGIHTLGVLVIDEIQHLSTAKSGGSGKMLNFFVELTNTMDMPVMLIGTTKAISIISQEFRSARRGCGQGEMVWRPMKKDEEWDLFLETLWTYQYTRQEVPLDTDLGNALYDESQGITDFAVKLYMLAQIRAIATGIEAVSPTIISSVAKDSLQTAQPFLHALRTGDYENLPNFEDIIQPLDYARLAEEEATKSKKATQEQAETQTRTKPDIQPKTKRREKKVSPQGLVEAFQSKGKITAHEAFQKANFVADALEFEANV